MFDEADSMAESRRDAACIRLNVDHWNWGRAVLLLEAVGGHRWAPAGGMVYRFITGVAREDALDLVRRKFGWTVASPCEARTWLLAGHSAAAAFRDGLTAATG
jgi:hypothetical protein